MTLIKKTFDDFAITEKRLKPITKNHWKKASDDQKEEWLLQAFSDPNDAEEFIEVDWEDLPDVATQNMYENFVDYYLTLNEGKVSKKHIDKKIDQISKLSKDLKDNFAKYKAAKTPEDKKRFMTTAAELTKKKRVADDELERLIQSFGKDMELDINFESVNEGVLTIAAGVALGLVGAIALLKGAKVAKNIVGNLALAAGDRVAATQAAKRAAKRKSDLEQIVMPIVKKFEDDDQLKKMYDELIPYQGGVSIKANKSNKKRSKQLQDIAKYIKSKLTPEEELYFTNVSKYLRDGVVESDLLPKEVDLGQAIGEAKDPVYKKGDKVLIRLQFKGGVGKFADSISTSKNTEEVRIKKRIKNKITGGYKYELSNWITVHPSEIVGLARKHFSLEYI